MDMSSEPEEKSKVTMEVPAEKEKAIVPQFQNDKPSVRQVPIEKENANVPQVPVQKENATMHQVRGDGVVLCANNRENNILDMGPISGVEVKIPNGSDDVDANTMGDAYDDGSGSVQAKPGVETEDSSSFGGTYSGFENDSSCSDSEVDSLTRNFPKSSCMRKKTVSDEWRKFIRPLKWRAKWLELQIHALKCMNVKYQREIAKDDERNKNDDCSMKSAPISSEIRTKIMKRGKRKRVEDVLDIASFSSQHKLFSYYEKRTVAHGASLMEYCNPVSYKRKIPKVNNGNGNSEELSTLDLEDNPNVYEQTLWKIEGLLSKVRRLKARMDVVMCENPGKYSSVNRLSYFGPCNALAMSSQNPASPELADRMLYEPKSPPSQCTSKSNSGDIHMPETAASSHRTVSLQFLDSKETDTEILQNNETANRELQGVGSSAKQLPRVPRKELTISAVEETSSLPGTSKPSGALSKGGNSTAKSDIHMARKSQRRRKRRRWGY